MSGASSDGRKTTTTSIDPSISTRLACLLTQDLIGARVNRDNLEPLVFQVLRHEVGGLVRGCRGPHYRYGAALLIDAEQFLVTRVFHIASVPKSDLV